MKQDKYIRPLGISWDKFSDMNMEKHRVVVMRMEKPHNIGAAPIWIMKLILPLANEATKTAVDNLEFEIFPREKNDVLVNEQTP